MPPEFNQTPIETPKKHTREIWFLVILGLLLTTIGGWFLYQNYFTEQPAKPQNLNLVATTTDEFADWKTYRNEEYGFEFKYPTDFPNFKDISISEPANQSGKVYLINGLDFTFDASGTNWPGNEYRMFGIGIWPIDYWDQYMIVDTNGRVNDKKYLDGPGPKYISKNTEFAFTYYKSQDCPDQYCKAYKQVSQILSTFKFISTSTPVIIDTSTWKTYKNTKYNYEFKYPNNVGVVSDYDSSFIGPPTNPEEDLLLIADKEGSFHFQVWDGKLKIIRYSTLGDQVVSTFKFTE